jgi:glutamate 5-kinase
MKARKRWLSFFSNLSGNIVIDEGAVEAIINKGRSLLPSGIIELHGSFKKGETVTISDSNGNVIAKGLSSFSSDELKQILGKKSNEIRKILGPVEDEAVHRNNLSRLK